MVFGKSWKALSMLQDTREFDIARRIITMLFKSLPGTFEKKKKKKGKIETVTEYGLYMLPIPLSGLTGNLYSSLIISPSDEELTQLQTHWHLLIIFFFLSHSFLISKQC